MVFPCQAVTVTSVTDPVFAQLIPLCFWLPVTVGISYKSIVYVNCTGENRLKEVEYSIPFFSSAGMMKDVEEESICLEKSLPLFVLYSFEEKKRVLRRLRRGDGYRNYFLPANPSYLLG